jgi:hypothetical protein
VSGVAAPPSRNAPCPCGSNRRYKDCHGAIPKSAHAAEDADALSAAPDALHPAPGYRPSGPDWDHLQASERSACAELMRKALKRQCAGKLAEAAACYAQVLALAPATHDALHMMGAIEMRRGNLGEAKRLIHAAMQLREPYPDIEHNLRMVEDLERAALVDAGRTPAPVEELCDRALSIFVDLALRPASQAASRRSTGSQGDAGKRRVHLIAGVLESSDDGAWLVSRMANLLAPLHPTVWVADRQSHGAGALKALDPAPEDGDFPRDGCLLFVGLDVESGEWMDRTGAQKIVVLCQPALPSQCLDKLRVLSRDGALPLDLVFPSHAMAARFGEGHAVLPPPIDTAALVDDGVAPARFGSPGFRTALIGRNWQGVSPSADADFLRRLAAASGRLEIYDPGALRYLAGSDPAVRFVTRGVAALRQATASVDCLLHVADKWWHEGDGREIFMAMAGGTPVLCPRSSMFAEYIEHGVNGLLYGRRDEAIDHIRALRQSPARGAALGRAARARVAALVEPRRAAEAVRAIVAGERRRVHAESPVPVPDTVAAD